MINSKEIYRKGDKEMKKPEKKIYYVVPELAKEVVMDKLYKRCPILERRDTTYSNSSKPLNEVTYISRLEQEKLSSDSIIKQQGINIGICKATIKSQAEFIETLKKENKLIKKQNFELGKEVAETSWIND